MTEQDLIKKIIKDAEKQAADLITAAQSQARSKIETARQDAEERKAAALVQAQVATQQRTEQMNLAREVALVKAQINAKQTLLDQVFNQARERILKSSAPEICKLVTQLTKNYAAPKDTILISKAWHHALPNLPITDEIDGGIIIEAPTYRIELSVDVLINHYREQNALTIAKMLGVM